MNNILMTQDGFNGHPVIVGSAGDALKAWQTDGHGRFTKQITYENGWNAMKLTAITGDVNGDKIPDMWAVSKTGDLRLYLAQNSAGTRFNIFKSGTGWASVKYFLPTSLSPRTIRAIFPDGDLRQYKLNSYTIVTKQSIAALNRARSYLSHTPFSKEGLYKQLTSEFEGFTANEAKYAVNNVKANWNAEALESTRSYQSYNFSFARIRNQLAYKRFTESEIDYALNHL